MEWVTSVYMYKKKTLAAKKAWATAAKRDRERERRPLAEEVGRRPKRRNRKLERGNERFSRSVFRTLPFKMVPEPLLDFFITSGLTYAARRQTMKEGASTLAYLVMQCFTETGIIGGL